MRDRRELAGRLGPELLKPIAWWYAHPYYIDFMDGQVLQWRDRLAAGSDIMQLSSPAQPEWSTASWGFGKPCVSFSGAESLETTVGPMIDSLTGTDVSFSLLVTFSVAVTGDNAICAWTSPGNPSQLICRLDNPSTNVLRFVRTNDAGTSNTDSGTTLFPNSVHTRAAYVFDGSAPGTTITTYLNGSVDINGAASQSGAVSPGLFRMGDGPGALDSFNGSIVEALVIPRAVTAAEQLLYYRYSQAEWG